MQHVENENRRDTRIEIDEEGNANNLIIEEKKERKRELSKKEKIRDKKTTIYYLDFDNTIVSHRHEDGTFTYNDSLIDAICNAMIADPNIEIIGFSSWGSGNVKKSESLEPCWPTGSALRKDVIQHIEERINNHLPKKRKPFKLNLIVSATPDYLFNKIGEGGLKEFECEDHSIEEKLDLLGEFYYNNVHPAEVDPDTNSNLKQMVKSERELIGKIGKTILLNYKANNAVSAIPTDVASENSATPKPKMTFADLRAYGTKIPMLYAAMLLFPQARHIIIDDTVLITDSYGNATINENLPAPYTFISEQKFQVSNVSVIAQKNFQYSIYFSRELYKYLDTFSSRPKHKNKLLQFISRQDIESFLNFVKMIEDNQDDLNHFKQICEKYLYAKCGCTNWDGFSGKLNEFQQLLQQLKELQTNFNELKSLLTPENYTPAAENKVKDACFQLAKFLTEYGDDAQIRSFLAKMKKEEIDFEQQLVGSRLGAQNNCAIDNTLYSPAITLLQMHLKDEIEEEFNNDLDKFNSRPEYKNHLLKFISYQDAESFLNFVSMIEDDQNDLNHFKQICGKYLYATCGCTDWDQFPQKLNEFQQLLQQLKELQTNFNKLKSLLITESYNLEAENKAKDACLQLAKFLIKHQANEEIRCILAEMKKDEFDLEQNIAGSWFNARKNCAIGNTVYSSAITLLDAHLNKKSNSEIAKHVLSTTLVSAAVGTVAGFLIGGPIGAVIVGAASALLALVIDSLYNYAYCYSPEKNDSANSFFNKITCEFFNTESVVTTEIATTSNMSP